MLISCLYATPNRLSRELLVSHPGPFGPLVMIRTTRCHKFCSGQNTNSQTALQQRIPYYNFDCYFIGRGFSEIETEDIIREYHIDVLKENGNFVKDQARQDIFLTFE